MELGVEKCAMLIMRSGKAIIDWKRTAKSRKNQNVRRKEKLEVLVNIRSGHHQIRRDERKKIFLSISGERENFSKPNYRAENSSKG